MRAKAKKKGLVVFIAVIVLLTAMGLYFSGTSVTVNNTSKDSNGSVAVLNVTGTIAKESGDLLESNTYNHDFTLGTITRLMSDSSNKGIFLFIDSPGGGVYESDELYLKLLEYKEKTNRPVYAYFGGTAASGGYYIAAAADKIYANRNTLTGSIGVTIGTVFDLSEFLEKNGIKHETITSGKNKAMGSPVDKLTKEQKAIYQSIVDESYEQFVQVVSEGRNLSIKKTKKLADGRVYTAKQAKKLNLVDGIATKDQAINIMKRDCNINDSSFVEYNPEKKKLSDKLLFKLGSLKKSSVGEVEKALDIFEEQHGLRLLYMANNF